MTNLEILKFSILKGRTAEVRNIEVALLPGIDISLSVVKITHIYIYIYNKVRFCFENKE